MEKTSLSDPDFQSKIKPAVTGYLKKAEEKSFELQLLMEKYTSEFRPDELRLLTDSRTIFENIYSLARSGGVEESEIKRTRIKDVLDSIEKVVEPYSGWRGAFKKKMGDYDLGVYREEKAQEHIDIVTGFMSDFINLLNIGEDQVYLTEKEKKDMRAVVSGRFPQDDDYDGDDDDDHESSDRGGGEDSEEEVGYEKSVRTYLEHIKRNSIIAGVAYSDISTILNVGEKEGRIPDRLYQDLRDIQRHLKRGVSSEQVIGREDSYWNTLEKISDDLTLSLEN